MPTERTLYVVVHGIGDPDPGETVRELARGLTAAGPMVAVTEERVWVHEPDPEADPTAPAPRLARTFPVTVLRDNANCRVLAEMNWADLSRFPISIFGLFEGVFSLLFGLRHVAYEAAAPGAYPGADVLRRLGRVAVVSLIGPLAATNILMLFLLAAAAALDWQAPGAFIEPVGRSYAAAGCVAAAAFGLLLRRWRGGREVYRLIGEWLVVVSVLVLAGAAALQAAGREAEFWRYTNLTQLRDALVDKNVPAAGGVVFYAAVAIVPLSLAFLTANGAALLAALVFFARFCFHREARVRNPALAATVLPFVMLFGWCVLIPVVWSVGGGVVRKQPDLGLSPTFQKVFQTLLEFVLADLPLWFFLLVVLGVAAALGGIAWLRKRTVEDGEKRLIVGSGLLWTLAAGCLLAPAVVFIRLTPYRDLIPQPEKETKIALGLVLAGLPLLPLVLKLLFPSLRSGLDLVHDVVTHFRPRFPRLRPGGEPDYYVRRAIQARLEAVVATSAARLTGTEEDPPCHLVIVSHSQGTMVALGALNDPELGPFLGRFASVRLVTMGSPFAHIYQHYFRHHYPALNDRYWVPLREVLAPKDGRTRWVNLYRVDDYVGRRVDDAGTGLVENQRVGVHGHTNYWSDTEIIGELVRLGIVRGGKP